MKQVASFDKVEEAELLRSFLESEGIPASVRDANTVTVNWTLTTAVGGVKVEVPDEHFAHARELFLALHPPLPHTASGKRVHGIRKYAFLAAAVSGAIMLLIIYSGGFRSDIGAQFLVISAMGLGVCTAAGVYLRDS